MGYEVNLEKVQKANEWHGQWENGVAPMKAVQLAGNLAKHHLIDHLGHFS